MRRPCKRTHLRLPDAAATLFAQQEEDAKVRRESYVKLEGKA